jgi:hypothetical protein
MCLLDITLIIVRSALTIDLAHDRFAQTVRKRHAGRERSGGRQAPDRRVAGGQAAAVMS